MCICLSFFFYLNVLYIDIDIFKKGLTLPEALHGNKFFTHIWLIIMINVLQYRASCLRVFCNNAFHRQRDNDMYIHDRGSCDKTMKNILRRSKESWPNLVHNIVHYAHGTFTQRLYSLTETGIYFHLNIDKWNNWFIHPASRCWWLSALPKYLHR